MMEMRAVVTTEIAGTCEALNRATEIVSRVMVNALEHMLVTPMQTHARQPSVWLTHFAKEFNVHDVHCKLWMFFYRNSKHRTESNVVSGLH